MAHREDRRYGMLEYQGRALVGYYIDGMAVMGHNLSSNRNPILQIKSKPGSFLHCFIYDLILIGSMLPARHAVDGAGSNAGGNQFSPYFSLIRRPFLWKY